MFKKISKKNNFLAQYIIMALVIIQPLLDTIYLYSNERFKVLGFSISTIINFATAFILCISILTVNNSKSKKRNVIIYVLIIIVYYITHCINCIMFKDDNFAFSLFGEASYVIRLTIPLIILYFTYLNKINEKNFKKVIIILISIISITLVTSNIFKISLGSFSNEQIQINIFDWFTQKNGYEYYKGASKGFFYFSNRVAAVLVMLLPFNFYYFFKSKDKKSIINYILIILHIISMFMLGSRIGNYGAFFVTIVMSCVYLFFCILNKESQKCVFKLLLVVLLLVGSYMIMPKSPLKMRNYNIIEYRKSIENKEQQSTNKEDDSNDGFIEDTKYNKLSKKQKILFIHNNFKKYSIYEYFLNSCYPYYNDPDFWYEIFKLPLDQRLNYRILEKKMLDRTKELNDNILDSFLGIGYTRTSGIFNLERDFVYQYYSMGIVGVFVFLGPYIALLLIGLFLCLKKFRTYITFKNVTFLSSIFLAVFSSILSGNCIDSLFVAIILSFICGAFLNNITKKEVEHEDISNNANL